MFDEKPEQEVLAHYGTPRHSGRYPWGSGANPYQHGVEHGSYKSDDVVFVSGKVKFDEPIPQMVKDELDLAVKQNAQIIIGDAPGADTRCQDYLNEIGYKNVIVYTTDEQVRNNVGKWHVETISGNGNTEEREIRKQKDIAMSNLATKGIVISSDDDRPDSATSLNIKRLTDSDKNIIFYDFKKESLGPFGSEDYEKLLEHHDERKECAMFGEFEEKPEISELMAEIDDYYDRNKPPIDELMHYGTPRHSGRYPWGSGDIPYQHEIWFKGKVNKYRSQGLTDVEICKKYGKELGVKTTTDLRIKYSVAATMEREAYVDEVKKLKEQGLNNSEIGRKMKINESTVRSLLNANSENRMRAAKTAADFLEEQIKDKRLVDVGAGAEYQLGITQTQMQQALYILEGRGYKRFSGRIPQITNPGKFTTQVVIGDKDSEWKEIYGDYGQVKSIGDYEYSQDTDRIHKSFVYPKSMDSKRIAVRYADEKDADGITGVQNDGMIEIRRGVPDLNLGDSRYAQVRILVDGNSYIKGMAVYSDNLPDGKDILINSNKPSGTPLFDPVKKKGVLKPITDDPDNPFGSAIKIKGGQSYYIDENGKEQLSLINKRAEEGDWDEWGKTLPSQFLSKQPKALVQKQLKLSISEMKDQLADIEKLENNTIKKDMLMSFASDCDATAVSLKAAALPRQRWQVIVPDNHLKEDEIYAPNYRDGELVALVRYPHGGTFEIPIVRVKNNSKTSKKLIGANPQDAVCINHKVAERLSGADFDGDTVMVIPTHDPNGKIKIKSTDPLQGLVGFSTDEYKHDGNYPKMKKQNIQNEMGRISNLITDMTIKGATPEELARATRHSMVVIDAYKHELDYKLSEKENGIRELKEKYQKKDNGKFGGASTIISRAKEQTSKEETRGSPLIDPETGKLIYKKSGRTVTKVNAKTGEVTEVPKTVKSTKMAETDDAFTLVSDLDHPIEVLYANYANELKALANSARKEYKSTKEAKRNPEATKIYAKEVESLENQVKKAKSNAPKEREAQRRANSIMSAKLEADPYIEQDNSLFKKLKNQALQKSREEVGAKRIKVNVSEKEWEAIQADAISSTLLKDILLYADKAKLVEYAMPKQSVKLTQAKKNRIKSMAASNYTTDEIAQQLGISPSTVSKYLKGEG